MATLVVNCNHWIGFHIVNGLLEQGLKVEGLVNDKKDDGLTLFFGRNSNFSFFIDKKNNTYDQIIQVGPMNIDVTLSSELFITLAHPITVNDLTSSNELYIELPLLFGEWMPMTESGMYFQEEFISFSSDNFNQHATYIQDFVARFITWLSTTDLHHIKGTVKKINLDKFVKIQDNRPKEDKVKQVIQHYRNYRLRND
ncbi:MULTISPECIES: hypothetical protein [Clostridia]|uniref:hypothetical protein n=1 Tax=Clostridia TaxID=186801 RepID=UPI000EA3F2B4|nr:MULTISPECIES: hypothetical protein [Clostridia]NBJ70937.1 hypothetical protein [Roseburia sp. 1XD42-34]RKI75579.1 hypothetical protein D7V87_15955 [Clostridium sp. 1xD42-85]